MSSSTKNNVQPWLEEQIRALEQEIVRDELDSAYDHACSFGMDLEQSIVEVERIGREISLSIDSTEIVGEEIGDIMVRITQLQAMLERESTS